MRLAWYAGVSTALGAGVVLSAFHQRANFYSATVYLSQSNLCLMILVNFVLLVYTSFMYGLQRLCYGQLRPVEVEQLYEKAWFAVTETCLAMTIFREEIGAFFLVMFTALVTGKIWGWIGEGRVEILEQQPPANPRLFHARLSISLVLSAIYNTWLLRYAVHTVIQQARPNMMVMFLFEFAVLALCSFHVGLRYILSLVEARVVKSQTQERLETRRREVREQRAEIIRQREHGAGEENGANDAQPLPDETDIDEMDIEVPGWEAKGQWVLSLDLFADFLKMGLYAAFFCVLLTFYGLPIHIMRDLFMTTRSFIKRLGALLRYRQAVRDMNKYPDATAEDLGREDTCIICREEMHPWDPTNQGQVERSRPKKLPCGHILHFGCLKSWLERQQVCPTCRRPVVADAAAPGRDGEAVVLRVGLNLDNGQNQQPPANDNIPGAPDGAGGPNAGAQRGDGVRMFNIGPLRFGFAQGNAQDVVQRFGLPPEVAGPNLQAPPPAALPAPQGLEVTSGITDVNLGSTESIRGQLMQIEQRLQREVQTLQATQQELQTLHLLLSELGRIRQLHQLQQIPQPQTTAATQVNGADGIGQHQPFQFPPHTPQMFGSLPGSFAQQFPNPSLTSLSSRIGAPGVTRLSGMTSTAAIPSGSSQLPEGVVIPPGWSLLPLQRFDGTVSAGAQPSATEQTPLAEAPPAGDSTGAQTNPISEASGDMARDVAASSLRNSTAESPTSPRTVETETNNPVSPPRLNQLTPAAPNWGGSAQLFSTGAALPSTFSPSPLVPQELSGEQNGEAGSSHDATAESSKNKGKAKATTVEDTEEEV